MFRAGPRPAQKIPIPFLSVRLGSPVAFAPSMESSLPRQSFRAVHSESAGGVAAIPRLRAALCRHDANEKNWLRIEQNRYGRVEKKEDGSCE